MTVGRSIGSLNWIRAPSITWGGKIPIKCGGRFGAVLLDIPRDYLERSDTRYRKSADRNGTLSGLVLRASQTIHRVTVDPVRKVANLVTPAKAGAHAGIGSGHSREDEKGLPRLVGVKCMPKTFSACGELFECA